MIKTGTDGNHESRPTGKIRGSSKTDEERQIDTAIGLRIRDVRDGAGEDLRTFGKALGVTAQAVHQWERGIGGVSHYKLKKLCDEYEISLEWLLTGIGRKRRSFENRMNLLSDSAKDFYYDAFDSPLEREEGKQNKKPRDETD